MKSKSWLILTIVGILAFYAFFVIRTGDLGMQKVSDTEISEFMADVPASAEATIPIRLTEGNPKHEAEHFIGPFRGVPGIRKVAVLPEESVVKVSYDRAVISEEQVRSLLH